MLTSFWLLLIKLLSICTQDFAWTCAFLFFLSRHVGVELFIEYGECLTMGAVKLFRRGCPFCIPTSVYEGFSSMSLSALGLTINLFNFSHSSGFVWYLSVVLLSISLTRDVEYLFMCSLECLMMLNIFHVFIDHLDSLQ